MGPFAGQEYTLPGYCGALQRQQYFGKTATSMPIQAQRSGLGDIEP
jgi:hypothetical protein